MNRFLAVRFWSRVDMTAGVDACWPWTGSRDRHGYGRIKVDGTHVGTHRVAWLAAGESIPPGLYVLHGCDNPPCVNPTHLFVGTQADNVRDMFAKGRNNPHPRSPRRQRLAVCQRGHDMTGDNVRIESGGGRHCRTCQATSQRLRRDTDTYRRHMSAYQRARTARRTAFPAGG